MKAKGGRPGPKRKDPKADKPMKLSTSKREDAEIKNLAARMATELPPPGSVDLPETEFARLPLSRYTLAGLAKAKYTIMTQIQRIAIPHALAGRDILGAAKTGSGKTLAFIVPILERLFHAKWTSSDGLGALIISPTRELALQIFEVIKNVGHTHFALTAGVVCGGKDFKEEQSAIADIAVLVATPGRLLQHLEQTPGFDCNELRALVLDEADRLLDMGFAETLNSIISYLPPPPQRQTMLFSATQTKSVKDLARLSLHQPEYVSVHEKAETATPARLAQSYVVCRLPDKLNLLYSFVRSHLKQKTIVFLSSCKEARFVFEAFRRLRPGVPLQMLHGKMKQQRRMLVYYDFLKKPACVLFATDIAARGLDFPSVDWVVQLDCPEDTATYIHRVGRTARFKAKGHGLLVLTPSESTSVVKSLQDAKIPITQTHINPSAAVSITGKIAAEVAADADLKYLAQKAFTSYVRSIYLQPNKEVFNVATLPLEDYAESLGLAVPPTVKISKKALEMDPHELRLESHKKKNENKSLARLKQQIAEAKKAKKLGKGADNSDGTGESDDGESLGSDGSDDELDSDDVSDSESGGSVLSDSDDSSTDSSVEDSDDSDDEVLKPKRAKAGAGAEPSDDEPDVDYDLDSVPRDLSRSLTDKDRARMFAAIRDTKLLAAGGAHKGKDGLTPFQRVAQDKAAGKEAPKLRSGADIKAASDAFAGEVTARLAKVDSHDRERDRQRVQTKHRLERLRAKGRFDEADGEEEDEAKVDVGVYEDGSESSADSSDSSAQSSSSSSEEEAPQKPVSGTKRSREPKEDVEQAALALLAKRRNVLP